MANINLSKAEEDSLKLLKYFVSNGEGNEQPKPFGVARSKDRKGYVISLPQSGTKLFVRDEDMSGGDPAEKQSLENALWNKGSGTLWPKLLPCSSDGGKIKSLEDDRNVWLISYDHQTSTLPLHIAAFVLTDPDAPGNPSSYGDNLLRSFLIPAAWWEMCSIGFFNHLNNANSDAEYMLEFRMSYLANVRDPMFPQKVDSKTGLVLQRQRAKAGEFYFETRLASLCLYKSKKGYRIIALTDDNLWDKDIPSKLKLSETRGRAVPCFHAVAVGLFMHMERECMNLLNRIDNSLHEGFQLEDTLDPKKLDHSMFDPTLTKSKFYFSTLLILRKSKGLLDRTARTWSALQGKLRDHPQFDYDQNRETWGITTKQLEKLVKGIQERIESKEKEITDLRDCLYNATSLREAVDGMAINKAIYLFTIITVIFAPLSFMTSLWALPFLNEPAPGDGKKVPLPSSFKQTMVVVPLSIMLICAAVLVWTWLGAEGRTKWKRNVIARLEGMKHSSRQENALKQMLKEKDGDLESGIPK